MLSTLESPSASCLLPAATQASRYDCGMELVLLCGHCFQHGGGLQVSEIGYDNLGIFRIAVLVTMSTAAVGGVSMVAADKLLTVHIARSIEFGKDVLRHR